MDESTLCVSIPCCHTLYLFVRSFAPLKSRSLLFFALYLFIHVYLSHLILSLPISPFTHSHTPPNLKKPPSQKSKPKCPPPPPSQTPQNPKRKVQTKTKKSLLNPQKP